MKNLNSTEDKTVKAASSKQTKSTQQKKKRKTSPQRVIAVILATIALVGCIGLGAVTAYAWPYIQNAPEVTTEDFVSPASSEIVDVNGTVYHVSGLKLRENISYDQLSSSLIDAFVAAEDSRFFLHNGFDIPRFTKAALNNLVDSITSGQLVFGEGGSTFTMQLIKNTFFVNDGSDGGQITQAQGGVGGIGRKITEIYLAQKLEGNNTLTKELILELYLNRIDFGVGNNIVGVENSAQAYFGKSASELSTVESAFMAGVINAPYMNTPYRSIENANEATQRVLYNMHYHGYITDEEYDLAKNVRIEDLLITRDFTSTGQGLPYQAYIDEVYREVERITGKDLSTTPMRVTTAIDLKVQEAIDKVQNREIDSLNIATISNEPTAPIQAASTVINNSTGEIVALFGGYDYVGQKIHNRATMSPINPGSTLKPVISYAPAYEYLGWSSAHIITDEPINLEGRNLVNYDNRFLGQITADMAVGDSRNIPAIKTFRDIQSKIGNAAYGQYLADIGLMSDVDPNASIGFDMAIGNNPLYVTTKNMAGATSMILNEGTYIEPHTVLKIEFKDGSAPIIPDYTPKQVVSPGAAYLAASNMKYVVDSGLNSYTNVLRKSYPTYAKTGTVQWDEEGANAVKVPIGSQKDRLMIVGTDDYTIATWVGFDKYNNKTYFSSSEAGFNLPGKLNSYLLDALAENHGKPGAIAPTSDLTTIKHITGPFPYQSPLEEMNPALISEGLVLKKHATLNQAVPQSLESLASAKAEVKAEDGKLNIDINLAKYPDESKLTVATDVLEMVDGKGVKFTGKRVYDESWIYGAVRYKTEVKVNGQVVTEQTSETENYSVVLDHPRDVTSIEVCSYYTFDLAPQIKSNAQCVTLEIPKYEESSLIPQFIGRLFTEIIEWTQSNSLPMPNLGFNQSSSRNFGTVLDMEPNISGSSVSLSSLKDTVFNLVLADAKVESGIRVRDFMDRYSRFITVTNSDINSNRNKRIDSFTINGSTVTEFWMGNHYGSSVTLSYEN